MKFKRSILIPVILILYLIGISIYAWPGRNPEVSYSQYAITIGVTIICIAILHFALKKREEYRNSRKNENK